MLIQPSSKTKCMPTSRATLLLTPAEPWPYDLIFHLPCFTPLLRPYTLCLVKCLPMKPSGHASIFLTLPYKLATPIVKAPWRPVLLLFSLVRDLYHCARA